MTKLIYAAVFLAVGVLAIVSGMRLKGDIGEGSGWPTVEGKVGEKRLDTAPQLRSRSFEPKARYTYQVDGKTYTSEQVYQIKGTGGTARSMQAVLDRLPETVKVHYDPKDPARAYLLKNSGSVPWVYYGAGALAILMGLASLLMYWNSRRGA
jgi:hypothetical protein